MAAGCDDTRSPVRDLEASERKRGDWNEDRTPRSERRKKDDLTTIAEGGA